MTGDHLIGPDDFEEWLDWIAPDVAAVVDSDAVRPAPSVKRGHGAKRGELGIAKMHGRRKVAK